MDKLKIYKTQAVICLLTILGGIYVVLTNNFTNQEIAKIITGYIIAIGISFIILDISINYCKSIESK